MIALLVYWRSATRTHVASLFGSTVRQLMAGGDKMEPAMQAAIRRFARRAPFSLIRPEEFSFFISVLHDLGAPIDVGAEILQLCENRHSISEIRDRQKMAHLAYSTDLKLSLQRLLQTAKTLHQAVGHRYPNITIALLASLIVREGWTFVEDENEALVFDYRQQRVRIPKQGSGKDASRLILFEEMAQKPVLSPPETGFEARKSARQEFVDHFDTVFDKTFLEMARSD
jgi:hypothetical protein